VVSAVRKADPAAPALAREELLGRRLVGLQQEENGTLGECPVERLLLLKGGAGLPASARRFAAGAREARELARIHALERIARPMAEAHRAALLEALPSRIEFVVRGYDYQDAELAAMRARLTEKARAGEPRAAGELTRLRERQRMLGSRREDALQLLRRGTELIEAEDVVFLAHALVVPSSDPEDRRRHDAEIEAMAVRIAVAHEQARAATVRDVSTPARAVAAGLTTHPGFDLLSTHPSREERAIEVKGRAGAGDIELTENEWAKACNLGDRYWLYVVFDCARPQPRLFPIRNPFRTLLARAKGGVVIDERQVFEAAEQGGEHA
jgi:hypothetical protein